MRILPIPSISLVPPTLSWNGHSRLRIGRPFRMSSISALLRMALYLGLIRSRRRSPMPLRVPTPPLMLLVQGYWPNRALRLKPERQMLARLARRLLPMLVSPLKQEPRMSTPSVSTYWPRLESQQNSGTDLSRPLVLTYSRMPALLPTLARPTSPRSASTYSLSKAQLQFKRAATSALMRLVRNSLSNREPRRLPEQIPRRQPASTCCSNRESLLYRRAAVSRSTRLALRFSRNKERRQNPVRPTFRPLVVKFSLSKEASPSRRAQVFLSMRLA